MKTLITILIILFVSPLWAADYYLRYDGSAAWDGTSGCGAASSAMSVATHNSATIPAGSNVYICDTGGDYVGVALTINDDGSVGNETTYLPASGDSPVFDGNDSATDIINITADYIVFGDLSGNAITVHNSTTAGILISSESVAVSNVTVQNCVSYSNLTGIRISQTATGNANSNHIIRYNTTYSNRRSGIIAVGPSPSNNMSDILISNNLAYSNLIDGGTYNQITAATLYLQIEGAAQHSGNVYYNTTPATVTLAPTMILEMGYTAADQRTLIYTDTSGTYADLTDGQFDYDSVNDLVYFNVGGVLSNALRMFFGGIENVTIEYNESRNCNETTTTNSDGDGIYTDHAVINAIIRYNYVHGNAGNGISLHTNNGSQVYGNVVVDNATASSVSAGIHYRKHMTGTNVLYNNTIINNGDYGVRFPTFNGGTVIIKNNVIKDHNTFGISLDNAGEWTVTEDYNDIYNNGTRDQNVADGANTIVLDPLLVTGYWLNGTSPAIGANVDLGYDCLEPSSTWPDGVVTGSCNSIGAYRATGLLFGGGSGGRTLSFGSGSGGRVIIIE